MKLPILATVIAVSALAVEQPNTDIPSWYEIEHPCVTSFCDKAYIEKEPDVCIDSFENVIDKEEFIWTGPKLTAEMGVNYGPNGKETYYNLDMSGVVDIMRNMRYSEEEYPYWVREDGCKMLGKYIMVATNFDIRPRGTLVETSLGTGLACDTGEFAYYDATQIDIAVTW